MGHRKGDPRPDEQVNAPPGYNAEVVRLAMTYMTQPKCDLTDPDAVAERYNWYMRTCIENDDKPSVAGMALAFGYNRKHLLRVKDGQIKSVPQECCDTLKGAWDALEYALNKYMMDGKLNPIPALFLAKNNFGYKDQTESVIIKQDPYESGDPEEIARRYLAGVAPALPESRQVAQDAPVVETVVVDRTGTVE